ncbi:MAG: DUF1800 domain-containing protein, partial [Planctomycetota bacterium]
RELCAAAGASALALPALAQSTGSLPAPSASAPAGAPPAVRPDPLLALVNRTTLGFELETWEEARRIGHAAFLERQLQLASIDDGALAAKLATLPSLGLSGPELHAAYPTTLEMKTATWELKRAVVLRGVHSRRQLFERTVEFWSDHFNIDHFKGADRLLKTVDDRDVIRRHAFGAFGELLRASAHSPAMSHYLDNWANHWNAPQTNYSRELLELHTLGVDAGYTETDVHEVARCFSGWSYYNFDDPGQFGTFKYAAEQHDPLAKQVLGLAIPAGGGKSDGEAVLDLLIAHPATRDRVCRKLCRWFLAYDPPAAVLAAARGAWDANGGDVRAVLRAILAPESLHAAEPWKQRKLKRPFHFATSLLRAIHADVHDAQGLCWELLHVGQLPFDWMAPNGYPDSFAAWSSGLRGRWNLASRLLDGQIEGVTIAPHKIAALLGHPQPHEIGAAIDRMLTGGTLAPLEVAAVQSFVDAAPNLDWTVLREAIALAASSPGYQWY